MYMSTLGFSERFANPRCSVLLLRKATTVPRAPGSEHVSRDTMRLQHERKKNERKTQARVSFLQRVYGEKYTP
jgi:hypothetical protein